MAYTSRVTKQGRMYRSRSAAAMASASMGVPEVPRAVPSLPFMVFPASGGGGCCWSWCCRRLRSSMLPSACVCLGVFGCVWLRLGVSGSHTVEQARGERASEKGATCPSLLPPLSISRALSLFIALSLYISLFLLKLDCFCSYNSNSGDRV